MHNFNEDLLQYVWQHKLLQPGPYLSRSGKKITVLKTGELNNDAGPDFFNGQVRVNDVVLAGNIEVHIIEVAPYSTDAKCGLARVCITKNDHVMAERIFQDICTEPGFKPEFQMMYAKLLLRIQKPDEAKIQYQLATSKNEVLKEPGLERLFS